MFVRCLLVIALFVVAATGQAPEPPAIRWEEHDLRFELGPTQGLRVFGEAAEPLLHVGGVLAVDFAGYDGSNSRPASVRLDRAVLRVEGRYDDWDWRIAPDLRGVDSQDGFEEAWISYWSTDALRVTAGLMAIPLTIENAIRKEELAFIGYAFPTYIDSRTDLAVRFDGEFDDGLCSYALAATAGDGWDPLGSSVDGYQFSARTTVYPFRSLAENPAASPTPSWSGLFLMGSYSYTLDYEGPVIVANPFRNRLFKVGHIDADSAAFYNLGYGADLGPVRLTHEWVTGGYRGVQSTQGKVSMPDQTTAWSASVSWMLSGEIYDSRPFRLRRGCLRSPPKHAIAWSESSGIGALELAMRYSNGDIDRDFFRLGFTNETTSSQEFRSIDFALNWYPVDNVKAAVQLVRTIADQHPEEISFSGRDTSVFFRLQHTF